jgi:hypothetical protein
MAISYTREGLSVRRSYVIVPTHDQISNLARGHVFTRADSARLIMQDTPSRSNGFDPDVLNSHLKVIDEADTELASLLGEYRASCRGPRGRIKNMWAMAKEQGLNINALREVVALHRAQRKLDKNLAELERDDADDFDAMVRSLGEFGDTPLGAAALNRARPASSEAALNSL